MRATEKRGLLVSKTWMQAVAIVMVFSFSILIFLAYRTYTDEPPIPAQVVDSKGEVLFTHPDVMGGQEVFLRNGLMEYGSIFGHGAYLGPDFTADYLHRSAVLVLDFYGGASSDQARSRTVTDFTTNRYDGATGTLTFTAPQASAFRELQGSYHRYFSEPTSRYGLRPKAVTDPEETRLLTAFFCWSAWTASARRPGLDYSFTNNWPPEPLVNNHPTGDTVVWSVLSLVALLGGIGLLLAAFGRWNFLGWHGKERQTVSFRPPDQISLTPSQRACSWFFLVMALLFVIQASLGGATQHYRADLSSFFGIDLARLLPFNVARTWHVQLSLFWVTTSFLAAGIFLAPMIVGREPRRQNWLAYGLLGALALVVFGSLLGEYAGIQGWIRNWWFGNQGFEYLDLGRFWQFLLVVGLFLWTIILFRGLRGRLRAEHMGNMPWLFFFSALSTQLSTRSGCFRRTSMAPDGSHYFGEFL